MIQNGYSITEFSDDNFAIIGRLLYIATHYEKSFRAYFTINACKHLYFFSKEVKKFSKIKNIDYSESILNEVCELSSELPFHEIISIFFDKFINLIIPAKEVKEIFIKAKNFRNYIAHELCKCELADIESNYFREKIIKEHEEEIKDLIKCSLMMENAIHEFNKESTIYNINMSDKIYKWVIRINNNQEEKDVH